MESIWKRPTEISNLNKICENTAVSHLGILITELGPNTIKATMPVDRRTVQPAGLLHGGASMVMAETLGSLASGLCNDNPELVPVGIEINANHVKSVQSGNVTGVVKPIHVGRSLHVWEILITNEKDQLCCISRLTVSLIPKK